MTHKKYQSSDKLSPNCIKVDMDMLKLLEYPGTVSQVDERCQGVSLYSSTVFYKNLRLGNHVDLK